MRLVAEIFVSYLPIWLAIPVWIVASAREWFTND